VTDLATRAALKIIHKQL